MPNLGLIVVFVIWLAGLLMYAFSANPKIKQLGFGAFCSSTLAFCLFLLPASIHI